MRKCAYCSCAIAETDAETESGATEPWQGFMLTTSNFSDDKIIAKFQTCSESCSDAFITYVVGNCYGKKEQK